MTFFKRNWLLTLFVIAVLGISSYLLYLSQQPPKLSEAPTPSVPKTSEPPTQPKPPVGDTSQGGHWHGDEWHATPHETPQPPAQVKIPLEKSQTAELLESEQQLSPAEWTDLDNNPVWRELGEERRALQARKDKHTPEYKAAAKAYDRKWKTFVTKTEASWREITKRRIEAQVKVLEAIAELETTPIENQARRAELNKIIDAYYARRRESSQ